MEKNQVAGKRLLLVEDDRGVREMLKTALSIDADTVVEANNGVTPVSLRSAKRRHPCQILVVRCGRASETVGERKLVSQPQPAAVMVC